MKVKVKKYSQAQCDSFLTPIIKKMFPRCLLCNAETQVAHHFIKKSVSSYLRYYLPNLINLCTKCHMRLHFNDEGLWNGKIALTKGKEWLDDLEKHKKDYVKTDWVYYNTVYAKLQEQLSTFDIDIKYQK